MEFQELGETTTNPETDIQAFIALYKRFGIELVPVEYEDGFNIFMGCYILANKKHLVDYEDLYTAIEFDKEGKFLTQVIWE